MTEEELPMRPMPKNYLVWSILSLFFCCLPISIVALVYSCQVNNYYAQRQYAEAEDSSRKARNWLIVSLCAYLVRCLFYVIISLVYFGSIFYLFSIM